MIFIVPGIGPAEERGESSALATSDQRIQLLSQALTVTTDVYKENARISALLDDKAQKTAGLAGIFLAAAFAFLRRDSLADLRDAGGSLGMVLLGAAVVLFLACVISSGQVMWVRKLRLPPDPNKILQVCDFLLADPNRLTQDARESHVRDQIKSWNRANQAQDQVISDKSDKLLIAQTRLVFGIVAVAVLLGLLAYVPGSPEQAPPGRVQMVPALREVCMAKCAQCDRDALPGSNLCAIHNLDGRDVLFITQDIDAPDPGNI